MLWTTLRNGNRRGLADLSSLWYVCDTACPPWYVCSLCYLAWITPGGRGAVLVEVGDNITVTQIFVEPTGFLLERTRGQWFCPHPPTPQTNWDCFFSAKCFERFAIFSLNSAIYIQHNSVWRGGNHTMPPPTSHTHFWRLGGMPRLSHPCSDITE